MAKSNSNNCGCLVLIGLVGIIALIVNPNDGKKETKNESRINNRIEVRSSQTYQQQTNSNYLIEDELSEEDKIYQNNSLSTGAMPYTQFYGKNYKCPYDQCSGIRVTAPSESDIVVIIKRNNQNGKVVAHGYVKASESFLFDIPDGTYQTFFYYGKGWNPNKIMKGGVKGGFVKDELFSKDNSQEIYSGILTYVLQLQRNGNFQTRRSSPDEAF